MLKKVGKKFFKAAAALALSAGFFTACGNIADITVDGTADGGARSASAGIVLRAKGRTASSDRFQFKISGLDIKGSKEVSFEIRPSSYSKASTITVRDGSNSNTKWLKDASIYDLPSSKDSDGETWYKVSTTAGNSTSVLGLTVGGAAEAGAKVYIKNLRINGSYAEISKDKCKTWSQPSEIDFSVSQVSSDPIPEIPEPEDPEEPSDAEIQGKYLKYVGLRFSKSGPTKDKVTGKKYSRPTVEEWRTYLTKFKAKAGKDVQPVLIFIVNSMGRTKESYGEKYDRCQFRFKKPGNVESKIRTYLDDNKEALRNYYSNNPKLAEYTRSKIDMSRIDFDSDEDSYCDELLKMCRENGIKVWLQIQPGDNDPVVLEYITLERFKDYKDTVLGLGIDCEWFRQIFSGEKRGYNLRDENGGDYISKALVAMARGFNPDYKVFAKHWKKDFMPKNYRDGMVFVNDSQEFDDEDDMMDDFGSWAEAFQGSPVIFQIGYHEDYEIWKKKEIDIINKLIKTAEAKKNKDLSIVWVDFTFRTFLKDIGIIK